MRKAEASKMRATAKRMLGVDLLRSKMGEVMERTEGKTRSMWGRIRWSPKSTKHTTGRSLDYNTIVPTPCQSLVGTVPSLAPLLAPGSYCSRLALPHDIVAQNTHLRPQR